MFVCLFVDLFVFFNHLPKNKKTIHKQANKQTNKKHLLDPKYLSQIKSDLHITFRETSCGCPMMFKTKKNKQIHKQTNRQTNKKQ